MKNSGNLESYLKIGGVVLLIIFLWHGCSQSSKLSEMSKLYESTQDTLVKAKDNLGREFTKIVILNAANKKALLQLQTKDSTILRLKEVVKNYKGKLATAMVLSNSTVSKGRTTTQVINGDTMVIADVVYVYPEYYAKWSGEWEEGEIRATRDTIYREIHVKNDFEITMGKESNGWFKSRQNTVTVKNLNPNTVTEELRTFQVVHPQKKVGISLHAGYGINLSNLLPSPYVGVGLDYRLINVK